MKKTINKERLNREDRRKNAKIKQSNDTDKRILERKKTEDKIKKESRKVEIEKGKRNRKIDKFGWNKKKVVIK